MMYSVKMVVTLIQVGSNLWINPMQITDIYSASAGLGFQTCIGTTNTTCCQSDWTIDQIKSALAKGQK